MDWVGNIHLIHDVNQNKPIATRDVNESVPVQLHGGPWLKTSNEKVELELFQNQFLGSKTKTVNEKMELHTGLVRI